MPVVESLGSGKEDRDNSDGMAEDFMLSDDSPQKDSPEKDKDKEMKKPRRIYAEVL